MSTDQDYSKKRKSDSGSVECEEQVTSKTLKLGEDNANNELSQASSLCSNTQTSSSRSSQVSSDFSQVLKTGDNSNNEIIQASDLWSNTQTSSSSISTQSSQVSSDISQVLKTGLGAQNGSASPPFQLKPPQTHNVGIQTVDSSKENQWNLELRDGNVVTKLLEVFSTENLPNKIIYNGVGYNLTNVFECFWNEMYVSPFFKGHCIKLPNSKVLKEEHSLAIVKILKRGWEDEHYFPKKIAQPFLEICLFNRESINHVNVPANTFQEYIDPWDKTIIQTKSKVDQESLQLFEKYCDSIIDIRIGDDIQDACNKAIETIMLEDQKKLINIWTQVLVGLLELEEFRFLMERRNKIYDIEISNNQSISFLEQPHNLWHTFLHGWDDNMIDYYFKMLQNTFSVDICKICKKVNFTAEHFLSMCQGLLSTMCKERHDCVMRKIEKKLVLAIDRRNGYFSGHAENWKTIIMYGNKRYNWPSDLLFLDLYHLKYPHIIVYSTFPRKRALVIELTISWESRMDRAKQNQMKNYMIVNTRLQERGYEVQLEMIVVGCRGVFSTDLYNMFEKVFGMTHSHISRTMESISKTILRAPYSFYMR